MVQLGLLNKKRIHVAIMKKSWGLTDNILKGTKTIESRWYMNKYKPWGVIEKGDEIYFKDSGESVRIKAIVDNVLQFENLTPEKVAEILKRYSKTDGLGIDSGDFEKYFQMFKNKKYCLLVFLKDVQEVEPFEIDKTGFGAMAAWLVVDSIDKIRLGIVGN